MLSASKSEAESEGSSNFMVYFITSSIVIVVLYIAYHKRQRVILYSFFFLLDWRRFEGCRFERVILIIEVFCSVISLEYEIQNAPQLNLNTACILIRSDQLGQNEATYL